MSGFTQEEERKFRALREDVDTLIEQGRAPSRTAIGHTDGAARVLVTGSSTGLARGKGVALGDDGLWTLLTSASGATGQTWGVVDKVFGTNRYSVIIGGPAWVPGLTITPGGIYTCSSGTWAEVVGSSTFALQANRIVAKGLSGDKLLVVNGAPFSGEQEHTAFFEQMLIDDAGATIGDVVSMSYVTGSGYRLAYAGDDADEDQRSCYGIIMLSLGGGLWLVLVGGSYSIDFAGGAAADNNPLSGFDGTGRAWVSQTTPGKLMGTKPASGYSVLAGRGGKSYTPLEVLTGEGNYTTITFACAGAGNAEIHPYPIPLAGGGTGTDLASIPDKYTLVADTVSGVKKIIGQANAGAIAFYTQSSLATPTWTGLDTDNSIEVTGGTLYARIGTKRSAATVPTSKQFLRYNGTLWEPYGPLLPSINTLLTHDGTDLSVIAAPVDNQLLAGVGGSVAWLTAPASADTILGRRGAVLTWAKVRAAEMDSQQTTGKWILATGSGGAPSWLTGEDARNNIDLDNVKCFRGTFGDTVIYGKADPLTSGAGVRLLLADAVTEPSASTGFVLAQRNALCSHWYFGSQVIIERPSYALFSALAVFDGGLKCQNGTAITFTSGASGSTSETYISRYTIYSNLIYAASVYPADGYTGTCTVRNSTNTGTSTFTFQNGILRSFS